MVVATAAQAGSETVNARMRPPARRLAGDASVRLRFHVDASVFETDWQAPAVDEGEQRLGGARSTTEQARAADPAHPRRQPRQTLTRRVGSMTHA